jgi:hypothetical protein
MLGRLSIAAPCPASWDGMRGDDRVRFCDGCQLNVYNLSGMTTAEATALVSGSEGRLCTRFFRRADGTVLTRDCPVGLAARVGRQVRGAAVWFFAALGLTSIATTVALGVREAGRMRNLKVEMGTTIIDPKITVAIK